MDDADAYDWRQVRLPAGATIDGAVIALAEEADGTITADVCIDGPPVP